MSASTVMAFGGVSAAHADDTDVADLLAVAEQSGVLDLSTVIDEAIAGETVVADDVSIAIPATAEDPVMFDGEIAIAVTLPSGVGDATVVSGAVPSGSAAFDHADGSSSVPLIHSDGSLQIVTVIDGASAPTVFPYELDLPAGTTTMLEADGSIILTDATGAFVGGVAPAWAVDANGTTVPTRYELTDSGFEQIVEHRQAGVVYPVAADPWLGINLIDRWRWSGGNIEVHVTPWMGAVGSGVAATAGWSELISRQRPHYRNVLNGRATYSAQWVCHAAGKLVIGFLGATGLDPRPAWGLEGYRAAVPSYSNPAHYVTRNCNW